MEPTLAFLHARFAFAMIAFAVVLGLWGSFQFATKRAVNGGFRSSYLLLIGLTAVQGAIGGLAMLTGGHPKTLLHLVYGIFAVIALPGVYLYVARGDRAREAAFLVISCWIVLIAFGRGLATGG